VARLVRLVAQAPSIDTGFLAKAAPQDEAPNVTRVDEKSLQKKQQRGGFNVQVGGMIEG